MRRTLCAILVAMRLSVTHGFAQTAAPPTATPATMQIGHGTVLALPPNWVQTPDIALKQAFFQRSDAQLIGAFHPVGSRPTVMPYALLEDFAAPEFPTRAEQVTTAEQVKSYYITALRPPSKAERAAGWKRANVTAVEHDFSTGRFSFRATIHFDDNSDYRVDVTGVFGQGKAKALSVWSDDSVPATPDVAALLGGLTLDPGVVRPRMSFQQQAVRFAQISGVLLILLIVGVQAFVFYRDRQQRRAEESDLTRDFSA